MIEAKVIADTTWDGNRITTLQLTYPRFIHAQLMTHRMFARNARSSRAIPVEALIAEVEAYDLVPHFGENKKGMQAGEILPSYKQECAKLDWQHARATAIACARSLAKLGVHKQTVNRVLEPYAPIHVVLTGTHEARIPDGEILGYENYVPLTKEFRPWEDFLRQRLHHDAQPEIQELARHIKYCLEGKPEKSAHHLPYLDGYEREQDKAFLVSAARCARVSYKPFDGNSSWAQDLDLADKLLRSGHMSPFEHCAKALAWQYGCFYGWRSYRHSL